MRATSTGIVPSTFFDGTVTVTDTSSPRRRASIFSTAAGMCTIGGSGGPFFPHATLAMLSVATKPPTTKSQRPSHFQVPTPNNFQLGIGRWEWLVVGRWVLGVDTVHLLRRCDRRKVAGGIRGGRISRPTASDLGCLVASHIDAVTAHLVVEDALGRVEQTRRLGPVAPRCLQRVHDQVALVAGDRILQEHARAGAGRVGGLPRA